MATELEKLLEEFVQSETAYHSQLQLFLYNTKEIKNDAQFTEQRALAEKLMEKSKAFLAAQPHPPKKPTVESIAHFFQANPDYLDLHEEYIRKYNPEAMSKYNSNNMLSGSLNTMLLPVQRLPSYLRLFEKISQHTQDQGVTSTFSLVRKKTTALHEKMQEIQFSGLIQRFTDLELKTNERYHSGLVKSYRTLIVQLEKLKTSLFKNNDADSAQKRTEIIDSLNHVAQNQGAITEGTINILNTKITGIEKTLDTPSDALLKTIKAQIKKEFVQSGLKLLKGGITKEQLWESACLKVLNEMHISRDKERNTMQALKGDDARKASCSDKFDKNQAIAEKNNLKEVQTKSRIIPETIKPAMAKAILHLQGKETKKTYSNEDYKKEYNKLGDYMEKPTGNENTEKAKDFASDLRLALISMDKNPTEKKASELKSTIKEYQSENKKNIPKELNDILKDITKAIDSKYTDIDKHYPPKKAGKSAGLSI